jgi:hypothetical protein
MIARSTQLSFAALVLAIAVVSLTGSAARAFSEENLHINGVDNSRFADPNDRVKNFGQSSQPYGANGPTVQFGPSQTLGGRPFGPHLYAPPPASYGNGNND